MEPLSIVIHKPRPDSKLGIMLRPHLDQIRVVSLTPGGLGEASGQLQVDDQIIAVNDVPVHSDIEAIEIVRLAPADVTLRLLRPRPSTPTTALTAGQTAAVGSEPDAVESAPKVADFYRYLQGYWKRNLQWREFGGGFRHLQSSNTLVRISAEDAGDPSALSLRSLRWSFGNNLSDMVTAYVVRCTRGSSGDMHMEWDVDGQRCTGRFLAQPQLAILEFILGTTAIIVTYHIRGEHMMAVSIVEVDDAQMPTVQYGNMLRIDASKYLSQQEAQQEAANAL
jgi:hypothetical protein